MYKNLKKILFSLLVIVALSFSLSSHSIADFGDFETYDSDSSWDSDWDSDWGSSSWDSDWSSSSWDSSYDRDYYYSNYDSGFNPGGLISTLIFIAVIYYLYTKNKGNQPKTTYPLNHKKEYFRDSTRSKLTAEKVMAVDKFFNEETFISNAKNLFVKLQNAWSERNLETLRPLVSVELFDQYSKNIKNYIDNKRINKIERIATNYGELVNFYQDNEKDVLQVIVNSSMVDYIIDEDTGKVLKGDKDKKLTNTYKMTFTRKKGILTEEGTDKLKTTNCPNCGAPTRITSSGRCEYCNSVITTGSHDWVLSGIERY